MPKPLNCVDHNKLWKILKEMGIPDHLTCPLRNLYAGQEATVRTRHRKTDWFPIGKRGCHGCILSPCFSSVQLSRSVVSKSATPWTAARQASLSITPPELAQTHVDQVSDAIQPSHPLSSPSPTFNLSQPWGLFK